MHTRCGQVVHRDSEGSECERIQFRNCAECLRPQPVPEPPPPVQLHGFSSSKAHESSAQSTRSGAARLDFFCAAGKAACGDTFFCQVHETSPPSCPVKVEVLAVPRFDKAYVSTDKFRVPQAGYEVFAAYSDTEEPGVISLRVIKRLPCFLAHCIGSRLGSEAYDSTEHDLAEVNWPVEDQM